MKNRYSPLTKQSFAFCYVLLLSGLILFPILTNADEVIMKNGDRLTGNVTRQDKKVLKLKTQYAGTLKISWSKVREIKFDEPVIVLLKDYNQLSVLSLSLDGDLITLNQVSVSEPTTINVAWIKLIDPKPWELGHGHNFEGNVNLAFKSEQGNSSETDVDFDYSLVYQRQWDRFKSFGQVDFETNLGKVTSNKWSMFNKYSRLFQSPWFPSVWFNIKRDLFADLNLQYMAGLSIGYTFYDSKPRNLSTELGMFYLHQEFSDESEKDFWGPGWVFHFDQFLWKDYLQFYHKQFGFLAASNVNKLLWTSWTGFRVPLIHGIVGSIEYQVEYDSQPAGTALTTDKTLRLKLGYEW